MTPTNKPWQPGDEIAEEHVEWPAYGPLVTFKGRRVLPPSGVYVTQDDTLELSVFSPTLSNTVNLSLRYMRPDGVVVPQFKTVTTLSVGLTPTELLIPGSEGFLLSASVEAPGAPRGQVFVTLELIRGQGTADKTNGHVLIAGYPGINNSLGFPQSPIASPLDGRGWVFTLTQAAPAAGAEIVVTVPAGEQWILRALRASLTASVAVANRQPTLAIDDGAGNLSVSVTAGNSQAAGTTNTYNWFPGAPLQAVSATVFFLTMPPELRLPPGSLIKSVTANIQAADQWSVPVLLIERFVAA